MNIDHPMKLMFNLEEPNDSKTNVFVVSDDVQWTELIVKFADFLSSHYGYDVKEKIVFVSDFLAYDNYSVVGSRTISNDAYEVAKGFDEDRRNADDSEDWGDDE